MPTISIILSDTTFAEAQSIAEPLVDTFDSLIAKLIHAEFERKKTLPNGNGKATPMNANNLLQLDPDSHDNLTHTRVLSVTVDGREYRSDWNGLLQDLLVRARKVRSWDEFRRISPANVRQGRHDKDGFKFMPDGDFSVQGVDANRAWEHSLSVARQEKIAIKVKFEWRDREDAAHPGETAVLEWAPIGS